MAAPLTPAAITAASPDDAPNSLLMSSSSSQLSVATTARLSSSAADILNQLTRAVHAPTPSLLRIREALMRAKESAQDGLLTLELEAAENLHSALSGFVRLREQTREVRSDLKDYMTRIEDKLRLVRSKNHKLLAQLDEERAARRDLVAAAKAKASSKRAAETEGLRSANTALLAKVLALESQQSAADKALATTSTGFSQGSQGSDDLVTSPSKLSRHSTAINVRETEGLVDRSAYASHSRGLEASSPPDKFTHCESGRSSLDASAVATELAPDPAATDAAKPESPAPPARFTDRMYKLFTNTSKMLTDHMAGDAAGAPPSLQATPREAQAVAAPAAECARQPSPEKEPYERLTEMLVETKLQLAEAQEAAVTLRRDLARAAHERAAAEQRAQLLEAKLAALPLSETEDDSCHVRLTLTERPSGKGDPTSPRVDCALTALSSPGVGGAPALGPHAGAGAGALQSPLTVTSSASEDGDDTAGEGLDEDAAETLHTESRASVDAPLPPSGAACPHKLLSVQSSSMFDSVSQHSTRAAAATDTS